MNFFGTGPTAAPCCRSDGLATAAPRPPSSATWGRTWPSSLRPPRFSNPTNCLQKARVWERSQKANSHSKDPRESNPGTFAKPSRSNSLRLRSLSFRGFQRVSRQVLFASLVALRMFGPMSLRCAILWRPIANAKVSRPLRGRSPTASSANPLPSPAGPAPPHLSAPRRPLAPMGPTLLRCRWRLRLPRPRVGAAAGAAATSSPPPRFGREPATVPVAGSRPNSKICAPRSARSPRLPPLLSPLTRLPAGAPTHWGRSPGPGWRLGRPGLREFQTPSSSKRVRGSGSPTPTCRGCSVWPPALPLACWILQLARSAPALASELHM